MVSALSSLAPLAPGWSRLLLCRHGETASNKTKLLQGGGADTPLNELGRKQAGQLADALAASGVVVDRIATSHLVRSIVTADPIASHFPAAQRVVHRGLGEMLYGEIEGKPIAEMESKWVKLPRAGAKAIPLYALGGRKERALRCCWSELKQRWLTSAPNCQWVARCSSWRTRTLTKHCSRHSVAADCRVFTACRRTMVV